MASIVENLKTRRTQLASDIASLSASNYDLPNISGGQCPTADMTGKIRAMYEELELIEGAISRAEGGFSFTSLADA